MRRSAISPTSGSFRCACCGTASSLPHQQYHDTDTVTVRVEGES